MSGKYVTAAPVTRAVPGRGLQHDFSSTTAVECCSMYFTRVPINQPTNSCCTAAAARESCYHIEHARLWAAGKGCLVGIISVLSICTVRTRTHWQSMPGMATVGIRLHSFMIGAASRKQNNTTTPVVHSLLGTDRLFPPRQGQQVLELDSRGPYLHRPNPSEAMGPSHFFLRARQKSQLFRSGCAIDVEAVGPTRTGDIGIIGIDTVSWGGCCTMSPGMTP